MARKGIYVEMAHHPQVVLDAMEEVELAVSRAEVQQKLLRILPIALMILGFLGFVLGILLSARSFGNSICLAFAAFPLLFVGFILLAVLGRRRNPMLREHFEAARQILYTLRDDTGAKGRVVGWLDLSGPQQKEKEARTARSGGGKQKVYYRDPWFKVKFKLADGNLLRLTLEDKIKTKAGSIVGHQSQFGAKLVVNPDLYRLGEVPARAIPVTDASLSHEDGVFVVKAASQAADLTAQQVLETLKAVYSHLVPMGPEPAPAGTDTSREA
jgi:hypothetical protein